MLKPGEWYKRICFSGRFDIPHGGHWLTVLRLLDVAQSVLIVVLDYEPRKWPPFMVKQFFDELIYRSKIQDRVECIINKTHFKDITEEEFEGFGCDSYCAAHNIEVLRNMYKLGVECYYTEPAFGIHASRYILDEGGS